MPRLYVGGLGPIVCKESLTKQFSPYGIISGIEIKEKKDAEGKLLTRFSYLNVEGEEQSIRECVQRLNGINWKDGHLKVELARESFMERLKREREGKSSKEESNNLEYSQDYNFTKTRNDKTQYYNDSYDRDNYTNDRMERNYDDDGGYIKRGKNNLHDSHNNDDTTDMHNKDYTNDTDNYNYGKGESKFGKGNRDASFKSNNYGYSEPAYNQEEFEEYRKKFLCFGKKSNKHDSGLESLEDEHPNKGSDFEVDTTGFPSNKMKNEQSFSKKLNSFHTIKRYDPTVEDTKIASESTSGAADDNKSFVKITENLEFNKSSGFSLLSLLSKTDSDVVEEDTFIPSDKLKEKHESIFQQPADKINFSESSETDQIFDNSIPVSSRFQGYDNRPLVLREISEPKIRKKIPFFVKYDDPRLDEGVEFVTTPLTDEGREEFEKVRGELRDILRMQRKRAFETERSDMKAKRGRGGRSNTSDRKSFNDEGGRSNSKKNLRGKDR